MGNSANKSAIVSLNLWLELVLISRPFVVSLNLWWELVLNKPDIGRKFEYLVETSGN